MKNKFKLITIITIAAFCFYACDLGNDSNKGQGNGDYDSLPDLTGTVSITGEALVGQTLAANISSLDGDGTPFFQWKRGNANIGSNSNTYVVAAGDVGNTITVTVSRAGYKGNVVSNPTSIVTDPTLPALTGTVTISGTAAVGQILVAVTTSLEGSGTIHYQWKSGGTIVGTNSSTYTVTVQDVGKKITVTVIRTGNSGSVTSSETDEVPDNRPDLTGSVSITGFAQIGQILTANTASLGGSGTITYQWKRGEDPIGTNSSTYTIVNADIGNKITVSVSRLNNKGSVISSEIDTIIDYYTITFDSKGGSEVSPITNARHGFAVTKPADPASGNSYTFDYWYLDDPETPFNFSTLITGSITLYARWNILVYNLGDVLPDGGIVFYYSETPFKVYQHKDDTVGIDAKYLVVAPDVIDGLFWDNIGYLNSNLIPGDFTHTEIGYGKKYTDMIIDSIGERAEAALACRNYGTGWFLPSIPELELLNANREYVFDSEVFINFFYWSSNQYDDIIVLLYYFGTGHSGESSVVKDFSGISVRPIRAF
ncbi:MAG: InlB B-repeat-containing protein [Treponema sp.]|nr:InlB B-repeat-containing protein [Treponema sp.]